MTINHLVRRHLARICSDTTMTRVVDPVLADIRWESRPRWLGYCVLLKALIVHGVTSAPGAVGRACSDDGHAVPKVAAYTMAGAVTLAVLLNALSLVITIRHAPVAYPFVRASLLLLPPELILTLPAALLIAIPLALKRQLLNARLARRVVVLSIGCAAVTFALLVWVLPEGNQAYRVLVSGKQDIARGRSEASLAARRREIERLRTFHGAERFVRTLEFEYHGLLALASAPVPLGLLALGLARWRVGRRRPLLFGSAALAFYILLIFSFSWQQRYVVAGTAVAPSLLAWLPNLLVCLLAGILLVNARSSFQRDPSLTESR